MTKIEIDRNESPKRRSSRHDNLILRGLAASLSFGTAVIFSSATLYSPPAHSAKATCSGLFKIDPVADAKKRLADVQTLMIGPSANQLALTHVVLPRDGMPMLLLLPGVNRGFGPDSPGVQALANQGFGVTSTNFSLQPFSVSNLPKGESPRFQTKTFEAVDLAREIEFIAQNLRDNFGVKDVIPVSLSYSGVISSHLKGFDVVVETVPMTSTAATNPQLETFRRQLVLANAFNPFGSMVIRSTMNGMYRSKWQPHVEQYMQAFKELDPSRQSDMVAGYVELSRISEGLSWEVGNLPTKTRRIFMVAEKENPELLKHQLQTFAAIQAAQRDAILVVVKESGHVIPTEQPLAYAAMMSKVLSPKTKNFGGIITVEPSTGKVETISRDNVAAFVDGVVGNLPNGHKHADSIIDP